MASAAKTVPIVQYSKREFSRGMARQPIEFRSKIFAEYGDIAQVSLHGNPFYFIKHPAFAEHILFKNQMNYRKHPMLHKIVAPFLGNSNLLLTNNVAQHDHDKSVINPAFSQEIYFENYAKTMVSNCAAIIDETLKNETDPMLVSMYPMLSRISQKNITETLFIDLDADYNEIVELVFSSLTMVALSQRPLQKRLLKFPSKFRKQYETVINKKKACYDKIISSRRKSNKQYDDILGRLLADTSDSKCRGDIQHHLSAMFSTGQITSSTAVYWTLIFISLYPAVEREMRRELRSVLGDRLPVYDDLKNLQYNRAVLLESIRYFPPIFTIVARQAIREDEIMGYPIPKGHGISISAYHVHHNEEFWKNPEGFDPQRFLDKPWGQDYQYAYIPFGAGRRACLGKHFALMNAALQIVTILQKCHVYLPENVVPKVVPLGTGIGRPNIEKMWLKRNR